MSHPRWSSGLPCYSFPAHVGSKHPDVAIGWDGIAYLEDVGEQVSLSALTSDGTVCQATFGVSADVAALSRVGPVSCR